MSASGLDAERKNPDEIVDVKVTGDNEVEPESAALYVGARIRWLNGTNQAYVIRFHRGSPFEDGTAAFDLPPSGTAISGKISERAPKGALAYEVKSNDGLELERLRTPPYEPTIIIRDPH